MRALILVAIVGGLAAMTFGVGLGEDPDAYLVAQRAHALRSQGFAPSRTWGFPLYELIAYPLIAYAGETVAKAWSSVCVALASVTFLAALDRVTADGRRALAGAIGFAALPVTIVASTTVLETAQGVLLAIAALLAWLRWRDAPDRLSWWYAFAAALGAAIATRPDYVLLAAAFAAASAFEARPWLQARRAPDGAGAVEASVKRVALPSWPHAIAGAVVVTACALLPYLLLYGRFPFTLDVVPPDPLLRRVVRAIFGLAALIGLPALIVIGLWIVRGTLSRTARVSRAPRGSHASHVAHVSHASHVRAIVTLAIVAGLLYFVRFVGLPDELDYVYILAPLSIAVMVASSMSTRAVALIAVMFALPNLVQVHLFARTPAGTIALAPGISPGAIAQEQAARRRTHYIQRELRPVLDRAAIRFGLQDYTTEPVPGSNRPVIIPQDALRFYRGDRRGGALRASAARSRIVVYPLATGRGWRQFLKPDAWRPVSIDDFREIAPQDLPD